MSHGDRGRRRPARGALVGVMCAALLGGALASRAFGEDLAATSEPVATADQEMAITAPADAAPPRFDAPTLSVGVVEEGGSRSVGPRRSTDAERAAQTKQAKTDARKKMVRDAALTPAARPPTVPGITQAEIDARRKKIEDGRQGSVPSEQVLP